MCSEYENKRGGGQVNLTSEKDSFKYEMRYEEKQDFFTVDYNPMFKDIIGIILDNEMPDATGFIAETFINTLAAIILDASLKSGCKNVCMSGGVFQNALLRNKAALILKKNGFNVYLNEKIPANDGGIAFGQAVYGGVI